MASVGMDMGGNQIFVSIKKGKNWPPLTTDVRVKYEETIGDLRNKVSKKTTVPVEKLQLFWHRKELVSSVYDHLTLAQMRIHTGFSFEAYDLTEEPDYWPPVTRDENARPRAHGAHASASRRTLPRSNLACSPRASHSKRHAGVRRQPDRARGRPRGGPTTVGCRASASGH